MLGVFGLYPIRNPVTDVYFTIRYFLHIYLYHVELGVIEAGCYAPLKDMNINAI